MSWKRPNVKQRMYPLVDLIPNDLNTGYWVDVGTGSGVFAELIERKISHALVIQTDLRSYSIKYQLHFKADLKYLPLRNKSLNGMVCAQVLHYIHPDQFSDTISSLINKLSTKGYLAIIEYIRGESYPWVPFHIPVDKLKQLEKVNDSWKIVDKFELKERRRPKYSILIQKD